MDVEIKNMSGKYLGNISMELLFPDDLTANDTKSNKFTLDIVESKNFSYNVLIYSQITDD